MMKGEESISAVTCFSYQTIDHVSSPGDYLVDSTIGPYCLVQRSSAQQWQFSWNAKKEEER